MVLLKELFEKVDFKKINRRQNLSSGQSLTRHHTIDYPMGAFTYLIEVTLRHAVGLQPKAVDCTHSHSNHNLNEKFIFPGIKQKINMFS